MNKTLTNRLNNRNGMMRRKQRPIYTQSITVQTVNGLTAMIHRNKKVTELEEQVQSLKKQLASHELRIESAERKITELRMDYEKLITKGS